MINTLLEHVPIKMETTDDVVEIRDEDEHIKDDDDIASSEDEKDAGRDEDDDGGEEEDEDEGDDDDDDDDDDDEEEDDEEEDEVLDVEQEVTLLISSDEEAELEAQRIRFPQKRARKKSNDSKSSRSISRNSSSSNASSKAHHGANNEHKDKLDHSEKGKEKRRGKDNVSEKTTTVVPQSQQRRTICNRKEISKIQEALPADNLRKTSRRQSNNSTCSVGSSIASDSVENESCGNIYVYSALQTLIFNCEFCDLKYGDLETLGRHLHQAHSLFMRQDEDHEKENSPRNMRSKQNHQLLPQKQPQHTLSVKKEPLQTLAETSPTTGTAPTSLLPPVALTLDLQSEHSLQSCGNVFTLNHRKLFLICGYCESKYANKELFEKHLRQQHDVFEEPAHNEVNVVPKIEIKEEVLTDVEEKEPMVRRNTLPGAMVSIPVEIPLNVSTTETTREVQDEEEIAEVQQVKVVQQLDKVQREVERPREEETQNEEEPQQKKQMPQEVTELENEEQEVTQEEEIAHLEKDVEEHISQASDRQDTRLVEDEEEHVIYAKTEEQVIQALENKKDHSSHIGKKEQEVHALEDEEVTPIEVEGIIQQSADPSVISEDVMLTGLDDVTATVISSSIQILDTGVTVAEIPVVLTEQTPSLLRMPAIGEVIAVPSSPSPPPVQYPLGRPAPDIIEEVQEVLDSPPPSLKRKTRKRRSSSAKNVDKEESPDRRPKRSTRKTNEPKMESLETKTIVKPLPRRRTVNKQKEISTHPIVEVVPVPTSTLAIIEKDAGMNPAPDPELEPCSSNSNNSPPTTISKKIKKEKERKPRRKSLKTKLERDPSPPRVKTITQIIPSDSQTSDRDEEFIEDPVADIIEQIQREMNASAEEPIPGEMPRILPPTKLTSLTIQSVTPSEASSSPNVKPNIGSLISPVDFKPIINELGERRFVCDQCPRSFKKHVRLVQHRRIHTGEKPFTCDECGKKFRIRNLLNEHKLRHSKEKKFICEICNLGCCTKQDYKLHMRHHTNDRRFQCSMCPKAFVRNADLKIHIRVHTGEKPYICDICHKCFRANQNLGVHKKSHMGEASKTYKCELCDKKFTRNIDRKVHMRSHTGEKPFKCEICDRAYSSRFNVKAHIERDHMSANGVGTAPRGKKKPGPKPKALRAELEKQRRLIEELQAQLKRQIKTDEMIIPADSSLNDSSHDEAIIETSNPLPEGFEIIHLPQPVHLTTMSSASRLDNSRTQAKKQTATASPLTIVQKMEQQSSSASSVCSTTSPSPPKKTATKVVSQKTSLGVQQVSVTVSMQVENVTTSAVVPEKETTGITSLQLTSKTIPTTSSVKKERKITSYFTVLNQKAEV